MYPCIIFKCLKCSNDIYTNLIFTFLASQILIGENFIKWKSNMNILLIHDNYHFVLREDCPSVPPANAATAVTKRYDRWVKANNKAHCCLLAMMNEVLRVQEKREESPIMGTVGATTPNVQPIF